MILIVVIAAIVGSLYGLGIPAAAVALIFYGIADTFSVSSTAVALFLCVPLALVVPVSVGVIASVLEKLAFQNPAATSITPLATVAAVVMLLAQVDITEYLALFMSQTATVQPGEAVALLASSFGDGVRTVLIVSLMVSFLCMLCELPFLLGGGGLLHMEVKQVVAGLRPLFVLGIVVLTIEFLVRVIILGF